MKKLLFVLLIIASQGIRAELTTFKCDYRSYSDEKGLHQVEGEFKMTFVADSESNKAYMVGSIGTSDVIPVSNDHGAITFIEKTATGNLMVTAITEEGKSVHSRHSVAYGQILPSQYYGVCEKQ